MHRSCSSPHRERVFVYAHYIRVDCLLIGNFNPLKNSNIILSLTHEYRQPSKQELAKAAAAAAATGSESGTVKADMTSRYLGLVVIPGEHIVTMEVEEFVSQRSSVLARRDFYT